MKLFKFSTNKSNNYPTNHIFKYLFFSISTLTLTGGGTLNAVFPQGTFRDKHTHKK